MSIYIDDSGSDIIYRGLDMSIVRVDKDVLVEGLNYINTVLLLPDNASYALKLRHGKAVYLDNGNLIEMYLKINCPDKFYGNGWFVDELNEVAEDLERRVLNSIKTKDNKDIRSELNKLNINLLNKLANKIRR